MERGLAVKDVKVSKDKSCSEGGLEGVSTSAPWKNFNHTIIIIIPSSCNSHAMTGIWTINDAWGAGSKAVQTDSTKTNTHMLYA